MMRFTKNESDLLKGIAILCVLICHFGLSLNIRYFGFIGAVGVTIFLFLSGYGLNETYKINKQMDDFWKKRFIGIFPAYLITEIVAFGFGLKSGDYIELIEDITLINSTHPYNWFLYEIVASYLVYYLLRKFVKKRDFFYVAFGIYCIMHFFLLDVLYAQQSLSFLLGVMCSEIKDSKKTEYALGDALICLFAGILILGIRQIPVIRTFNQHFLNLTLLMINIMFVFAIIVIFRKFCKCDLIVSFLAMISSISYEIYLVHGYLLRVMRHDLLICFVLTVGLSYIIFCVSNRLKRFIKEYEKLHPNKHSF